MYVVNGGWITCTTARHVPHVGHSACSHQSCKLHSIYLYYTVFKNPELFDITVIILAALKASGLQLSQSCYHQRSAVETLGEPAQPLVTTENKYYYYYRLLLFLLMLKFTYYSDAVMNIHCRLREDKFSSHLKVLSDDDVWTDVCRLFHVCGAARGNVQSCSVDCWAGWTVNVIVTAEWRWRKPSTLDVRWRTSQFTVPLRQR